MDAEAQPADAAMVDTSHSVDAALSQSEEGQLGAEAAAVPDVQAQMPSVVDVEVEKASEGAQGNGNGSKKHKGRRKRQSKGQSNGSVPVMASCSKDTAPEVMLAYTRTYLPCIVPKLSHKRLLGLA